MMKFEHTGECVCPEEHDMVVVPDESTSDTNAQICGGFCHASCLNCTGGGTCTECLTCPIGSTFNQSEGSTTGSCEADVDYQWYSIYGQFQPTAGHVYYDENGAECQCHVSCATCDGASDTQCTSCAEDIHNFV